MADVRRTNEPFSSLLFSAICHPPFVLCHPPSGSRRVLGRVGADVSRGGLGGEGVPALDGGPDRRAALVGRGVGLLALDQGGLLGEVLILDPVAEPARVV